ncbi:dihydrodipicolinate synthase family protein [Planctomicrobium sp. SH664]|uniref:dihydrodipicolinate synthase family protein n=1 Tax=Planctomicrobium sp. SH664 TaxID=3448125 RepID=UPI003F5C5164
MEPKSLCGIFTPNLVPLDEHQNINEAELRRHVEWLIQQGVQGMYPNGSTGEFLRFTAEERREIVRIIADQVQGRVPILAGAVEANPREILSACEYYAELGCRAVALLPPIYYKLSPDRVYAHFREIGRNSPIDITLYNIPLFVSPIDIPTIQRLSEECERIVGIKDSSGDVSLMLRMIEAVRPNRPEFSFLAGWEPSLMAMLLVGCTGGTNATANIFPEAMTRLYSLARAQKWDEARAVQANVADIFEYLVRGADFPDGFRVGAQLRGFEMGPSRQPMTDQQAADLQQLKKKMLEVAKVRFPDIQFAQN